MKGAQNCASIIIIGSARSKSTSVLQGVPQGSVLGARLYTLYVRPMSEICKRHDIHYHSYADDTQLYVHYDVILILV